MAQRMKVFRFRLHAGGDQAIARGAGFPERPQQFNGKFEIPTFEEIIALAKRKSVEKAAPSASIRDQAPDLSQVDRAAARETAHRHARRSRMEPARRPVFRQSFEPSSLMEMRRMSPVRSVQLVDANDVNPDGSLDFTAPFDRPFDWTASRDPRLLARTFAFLVTDEGLREVKTYADGIGPWKRYIVSSVEAHLPGPGEASRTLLPATNLIQRAHKIGLLVHTWTFRNEQKRLVSDYAGNPVNEYLQFYRLGIDGVFSDFADTAVAARVLFDLETNPDGSRCLIGDPDAPPRQPPMCVRD
jgi:glycerophosphoryl diester phosphodiesterase